MVMFVLNQAFLGKVFPDTEFLFQEIQDLPVYWYRVDSDDKALMTWALVQVLSPHTIDLKPSMLSDVINLVSLFWVSTKDLFE